MFGWQSNPKPALLNLPLSYNFRPYTTIFHQGEDRYYDQVWAAEPYKGLHLSSNQSLTRPHYLRYQNGQSDLQRGNVPEQGFPQLSSSYNSELNTIRRGADLSQTWSGPRWGESPPHVSINQSLPPIGNKWRASRWQPQLSQVDSGARMVVQEEQRRVGRWSRRSDLPSYQTRITPDSRRVLENGLRKSEVVSRSESCLIDSELPRQAGGGELARSTPSLAQQEPEPPPSLSRRNSSSLSSSLTSVDSQQPNPNLDNERKEEKTEEVVEDREEPKDGEEEGEAEEVNGNEPLAEVKSLDEGEVNGNEDERDAEMDTPEIGTPDTKSLGTPSSEFGSESSKTTEISVIECNNNGEEKLKRRIPRSIELSCRGRAPSKERPPLFPPTLPPFDNPKDAFLKTLLQLENPEWEVVMQGLQGLVRLCRHHSKLLTASAHSVVTSLVHNIRNLRSQVSRGSCQASRELFDSIGRFLDAEVEDLATALLSRTADTNKFLRGDALSALESMVDHSNPVRSIAILANKGSKHQNGVVRCATSRLLLRLTKRLGAERCLSLPKDSRDLLILTGAKLLTEGSLDTRRYSKEMFQVLSSDGRLLSIMSEVVPNNVLRNINKVLSKIAITTKK